MWRNCSKKAANQLKFKSITEPISLFETAVKESQDQQTPSFTKEQEPKPQNQADVWLIKPKSKDNSVKENLQISLESQ